MSGLELIAAIAFVVLLLYGAKDERQARRDSAMRSGDMQPKPIDLDATGPKHLARWMIKYVDARGETTHRVIRVLKVHPNLGQVVAWCELRNDQRTFILDRIEAAADMETGELVTLPDWLRTYRRSRRPKR